MIFSLFYTQLLCDTRYGIYWVATFIQWVTYSKDIQTVSTLLTNGELFHAAVNRVGYCDL